ncbi:MAG: hypothetical protein AAF802_03305 [Planctomycetota bacterium]
MQNDSKTGIIWPDEMERVTGAGSAATRKRRVDFDVEMTLPPSLTRFLMTRRPSVEASDRQAADDCSSMAQSSVRATSSIR